MTTDEEYTALLASATKAAERMAQDHPGLMASWEQVAAGIQETAADFGADVTSLDFRTAWLIATTEVDDLLGNLFEMCEHDRAPIVSIFGMLGLMASRAVKA